ncbi:MAG: AraC family transcriptional regulator [Pseudomonadales bacterium]|nr:AraC family transcriptional regulator [Pseudomonadales bacterium]
MNPVQKANWYIESFLSSELSLERIARASCVTPFHLTRAFGQATGRSVMKFVRQRRLTVAAHRLASGGRTVMEIALDAQYLSHEAFSRAFREQFGVTPDHVRRQGTTKGLQLTEACIMSESNRQVSAPRMIDHPEMLMAGIVRSYSYESSAAIPAQWNEFNEMETSVAGFVGDAAYGVIYNDDSEGNFQYLTAMEVQNYDGVGERYARLRIPARRYAVFSSDVHVSGLKAVMHDIWSNWLPGSGHAVADAPMLEVYGSSFNPQTGMGGFEIWLPLAS